MLQNNNGLSGALCIRIASDGCKDGIPKWGSIQIRLHGIAERFCHGRQKKFRVPPEEIDLWLEASLKAVVFEN